MSIKELLSLKREVILVTGGSSNYGKCIVEGLAEATAKLFTERGLDVHPMQVNHGSYVSVIALKSDV